MFQTAMHWFFFMHLQYNMVQVIQCKIILYRKDLKGKQYYFKLVEGSSYGGFKLPRVKLQ